MKTGRLRRPVAVYSVVSGELLPVAAGARRLHLGEAVATVDRPVLARQERNLRVGTAIVANSIVHLASAAIAAAAVGAPGLPARRAALRLLVSLAGVKLLVVRGERAPQKVDDLHRAYGNTRP